MTTKITKILMISEKVDASDFTICTMKIGSQQVGGQVYKNTYYTFGKQTKIKINNS